MQGKEAVLYEKLKNKKVMCKACSRRCTIAVGNVGVCGVRQNIDGKLFLLVYGKAVAANIDPIEKKPVSHYMPGSMIFSIGTTGCNFACQYCCNFDISQRRKVEGSDLPPEKIVQLAKEHNCQGISYTYNEPTIFIEYAYDTGILAKKEGLINIFVTNGYETPEAVDMASKFLTCATVDFKGSGETKFLQKYVGIPNAEPIYQTLLEMKKHGIHIEVTDLIIPRIGDKITQAKRLVKWVHDNLGPDIPLHFLRFHPTYKLTNLSYTPTETLEKCHAMAKKEGMRYVYIGNIPGHPLENTYCPNCKKVVVERFGFSVTGWHLDKDNKCKFCGEKIAIIGTLQKTDNRLLFKPFV